MDLTIITPTYNRAENLKTLYESLIEQTNQQFDWLIVDDGSSDNTSEVVDSFKSEGKLKITYIKKQNGGKHTALNVGIKTITSPLTFIVDSDDWLCKTAVDDIINIHNEYKDNDEICGYSFMRQYPDGTLNGKAFDSVFVDTYINARINAKDMQADKAEVWLTKRLNEYPFAEFEGERFLGEDSVWVPMALKYKMVFINKAIYISDYLENGLTNNRRRNNIKSPNGCFYRAKVTIDASRKTKIDFIFFIKCLLQFQIYGRFAKKSIGKMMSQCPYKLLFVALYPLSFIIYKKWQKEFKEQ